jgi:hypothetical protein
LLKILFLQLSGEFDEKQENINVVAGLRAEIYYKDLPNIPKEG